ncbi:hypothetical protein ACFXTH_003377 [Malus domestica]
MGAHLPVFHSSKAFLNAKPATINSKTNFGDSCCNQKAQVIPSDARSHPNDPLFRPIQMRDDKGADTGGAKFFYERNNSTQKACQGQTNIRKTHSEASFVLVALKDSVGSMPTKPLI